MKWIAPSTLPLLEALVHFSPNSSKTTLREWIREGRVQIDGLPIKTVATVVREGQEVRIGQRKKIIGGGIEILYADEDLVAIYKPTGLLSVAAAFEKHETAHALLKTHFRKAIFVIHRLDQDTSGVMLFAFNQKTLEGLKELFKVHAIQRAYTAVVEGRMTQMSGTWESYLVEDANYNVHETYDTTKGQQAITHFETLKAGKKYSLLELTLETGRKNQIRVHCTAAGHPVAGDKKYGAQTNPLKRLCLHAHLLGFKHPISKKEIRIEAPPPEEFQKIP